MSIFNIIMLIVGSLGVLGSIASLLNEDALGAVCVGSAMSLFCFNIFVVV